MAYKTPGVYVEEISVFPPSVAEVETAIPAFIGYTEKAERRGGSIINVPTRISSLLEFHQFFGGAQEVDSVAVTVDETNQYAVTDITVGSRFYMYDSLRLFFDNGGGKCYIVSVGLFQDNTTPDSAQLQAGLDSLKKKDEPTIILFPDAVLLANEAEFYTLQQRALTQCADLQDRVSVFDLFEGADRTWVETYEEFRNRIGINNLKYGAAYTPWLNTTYPKQVDFGLFRNSVNGGLDLSSITTDPDLNGLVTTTNTTVTDHASVEATITANLTTASTLQDQYREFRNALDGTAPSFAALVGFVRDLAVDLASWSTSLTGSNLQNDLNAYATSTLKPAVESLIAFEKHADVRALTTLAVDVPDPVSTAYESFDNTGWLDSPVDAITADGGVDYGDPVGDIPGVIDAAIVDLGAIFQDTPDTNIVSFIAQVREAAAIQRGIAQSSLYERHSIIGNIVARIKGELATVPPSGAIAGIYATVDRTRGVWKAPANVSVASVGDPAEAIDDSDQEELNVDATGGKSINAIRAFTGRGILVWGARTLAGNDNEWRYVPVRRFFNMVEESVKKSSAFAVFEPNSAPTWTRVKSMIENYLIQKWRDGALAGAVPAEAFFVKIGLGETMTAQDILEGRMNVEIGMAVVRPAEFIILKFSHKLQES